LRAEIEGAGTVVASGGRLEFQDAVDATSTSTFNISSAAILAFDSTVGTNALRPNVTFTGASASVLDLSGTTLGNFHGIVAGFGANEGIRMPSAAVSFSKSFDGTNTTVTAFDSGGGNVGTITLAGDYSSTYFHIQNGGALDGDMVVCFMPGTLIRIPGGERAVEAFQALGRPADCFAHLCRPAAGASDPDQGWRARQQHAAARSIAIARSCNSDR
jgi:hypothetical protein